MDRRTIHFDSLADLLADAETMASSGSPTAAGNWTPAQVMEHVAIVIDRSVDGFAGRAPWLIRTVGPLLKRRFLSKPFSPGIKIPGAFNELRPADDVTLDQAIDHLRRAVAQFEAADRVVPSPIFGSMTKDDWIRMHCRHAEMHFSFLGEPAPASAGVA